MSLLGRTFAGAIVACALALPGLADPPAPIASPDASPAATAEATATATASAAPSSSVTPDPSASGSYKEELRMAALATSLLLQAQSGEVDRSLLESKMNLALSPSLVQGVSKQLAPLGKPKSITFVSRSVSGDYTAYKFRIVWDGVSADESFALNTDGKIVAWLFQPVH